MRRMLATLAIVLVLAYATLCALLFLAQRKMIYLPEYTRTARDGTDYALARDGIELRGWIVNPGQDSAIVYFGGNGESVQANRDDFARWFPRRTVYLLAYRGYGASDGAPSGDALLDDALAFFDDVQTRHPDRPVSAIGRSLGSGIASHVAAQRPVDRLALVTPFDSLANVAQSHYRWLPVRWLLRDRYPSVDFLRAYRGPVLMLRAGRDEVIPPANTDALERSLPRAHVVAIDEAGHNDIQAFPAYGEALAAFLQ
ncbi:lysophospholipase [Luteimonas marina]|uniref:Lysophospholipase n=1 Tax=Luteimonas marina TaxID=488485 RepID=A0A5C5UDX1_9GAMM|nr:alpha/beta fold hydrolase [Luteimonas marina]TWT23710.1 lysophospholipase [Luteimonas marina]